MLAHVEDITAQLGGAADTGTEPDMGRDLVEFRQTIKGQA